MGILKYIADKLYSNDSEVALVEDNGGIESGSDINGSWIKFPDGTLICTGKGPELSYQSTTSHHFGTVSGDSDFRTGMYTFPMAFIDYPSVSFTANNYYALQVYERTITFSSVEIGMHTKKGEDASKSIVTIVAIGRWK